MQTIFYGDTRFETDDTVAEAVLDYAEKLAGDGSCAVVRVPIVSHGLPAISRLLIGAGLPVAVQTDLPGEDVLNGYVVAIDPFEVRRALNAIGAGVQLLEQRVLAHPFSADAADAELWDVSFDADLDTETPDEERDARVSETVADEEADDRGVILTRSGARTSVGNVTRITTTVETPDDDETATAAEGALEEESGDPEL
jgi:hypothetical protein